jgi:hypothetical protein
MNLEDDLKELEDKVDGVVAGNRILNATVIKADVKILRAKVMKDDPGDKHHIIRRLDGIDKDLDAFIERQTRNANPK